MIVINAFDTGDGFMAGDTEGRAVIVCPPTDRSVTLSTTLLKSQKRQRQRRLLFEMQGGRCCYCECAVVLIEDDCKPHPKNLATLNI